MCSETVGRAYLVTLLNDQGRMQKIIVQTTCLHGMQEFIDSLPDLKIHNPVVIDIVDVSARMAARQET